MASRIGVIRSDTFDVALSLGSDRGPDATVMGGYVQRRFLQGYNSTEIKIAAVELFEVVAADWKPK
jgi:hypothetical protein